MVLKEGDEPSGQSSLPYSDSVKRLSTHSMATHCLYVALVVRKGRGQSRLALKEGNNYLAPPQTLRFLSEIL